LDFPSWRKRREFHLRMRSASDHKRIIFNYLFDEDDAVTTRLPSLQIMRDVRSSGRDQSAKTDPRTHFGGWELWCIDRDRLLEAQ
jgi:hypothetical protein